MEKSLRPASCGRVWREMAWRSLLPDQGTEMVSQCCPRDLDVGKTVLRVLRNGLHCAQTSVMLSGERFLLMPIGCLSQYVSGLLWLLPPPHLIHACPSRRGCLVQLWGISLLWLLSCAWNACILSQTTWVQAQLPANVPWEATDKGSSPCVFTICLEAPDGVWGPWLHSSLPTSACSRHLGNEPRNGQSPCFSQIKSEFLNKLI